MKKEQKAQVVDELAAQLGDAQAIYAVDYRGISVPQAAELRASLREHDASFRIVKNTLTLRAADKAGVDADQGARGRAARPRSRSCGGMPRWPPRSSTRSAAGRTSWR